MIIQTAILRPFDDSTSKPTSSYISLKKGIVDKTILNLKTTVEPHERSPREDWCHIESLKEELSKQKEMETLVREYLPLLRELAKDPEIKKRLASLKPE